MTFRLPREDEKSRTFYWPSMTMSSPRFRGLYSRHRLKKRRAKIKLFRSSITSGDWMIRANLARARLSSLGTGKRTQMSLERESNF